MEDGLAPEDEYEENGDNRCQRIYRENILKKNTRSQGWIWQQITVETGSRATL